MDTKFASPERKNLKDVIQEFHELKKIGSIQELINALPYVATVLNEERQIIFTNNSLLEMFGLNSIDEVLGFRPGEVIQCIHSNLEEGGCGTSEYCKVCGAVRSIEKSRQLKTKVVDECRITSKRGEELISYDFEVSATPFKWLDKGYTIFTILDKSDEKRRRALERIFFHDIINKTGGLSGFLEIINELDDKERIKEITMMMQEVMHDLNEEILAQRQLLDAENNELRLDEDVCESLLILRSVVVQLKHHPVSAGKEIFIDGSSDNVELKTDPLLLKRVLTNMTKNALEASSQNQNVILESKQDGNFITFKVKNRKVIPRHIQLQIFQRSFSTKGSGRGLGTYSMKLIGENYLGGKVSFISNEGEGTIFMIELPINT